MKKTTTYLLAACLVLVAAARASAPTAAQPVPAVRTESTCGAQQTLVTFTRNTQKGQDPETSDAWHRMVALPPNASTFELRIVSGETARVSAPGGIRWLRGQPVISVVVEGPGAEPVTVAVRHDGSWPDPLPPRSAADGTSGYAEAAMGMLASKATASANDRGSYVIITAPEYLAAAEQLADWKQRKGLPVVVVQTDEIGTVNTAIQNWLHDAYTTWDSPPEYVLLLGDVDDIPAWSISQNLTDLPYMCVDGDDWLPDLALGRMPVESLFEAETIVAKSIAYERTPYLVDDGWFTRSLAVAGNYPAPSPVSCVTWCAEQLQTLGFAPATSVLYPPVWNGIEAITAGLEAGASIVIYRGWAYGPAGWQPPEFTVDNIPGANTGPMTPIVLSFVCHTGNFAHDEPSFGEVFLRQGSPSEIRGAVAFYGNSEAWSHTRFNDAMAISFFETFVREDVHDLGTCVNLNKLRFMDYFPNELYAADHDEESVEFYFHIYNLMGDPELGLCKQTPVPLRASHPESLPAGANLLELQITEADETTPLAGARVGVVQGDQLLGSATSDAAGFARVALMPLAAALPVALTITHPGRLPYQASLFAGDGAQTYVVASGWSLTDDGSAGSSGNGDGAINPGETVAITPRLFNSGAGMASGVVASLTVSGPVTVTNGTAACPDVPGGSSVDASQPFLLSVAADASDGARILGHVSTSHAASGGDASLIELSVAAPDLVAELRPLSSDGAVRPGATVELELFLRNEGSLGTLGGTASLALQTPDVGLIGDGTATFGELAADADAITADDTFTLQIDPDIPMGTGLSFILAVVTSEGYELAASASLQVGPVDIGAPVGPDSFGYYAYDSADINYPAQLPWYNWRELSPTFGGSGTEIPFYVDSQVRLVDLPFSFTFYDSVYTQIRVSDSGWISFDTDGFFDFYNWPIPSPYGNHSVVAPFWDNLHPTPDDATRLPPDGVFTEYDAETGTFTVEWSRVSHYRPEIDDLQTFQVVLRDPSDHPTGSGNGEILFLYRQVNNSDYLRSYATVGIESPGENDGLQLTYGNVYAPGAAPLSPGLAVKLTTEAPVYDPYRLQEFTAEVEPRGVQLAWKVADNRPVLGWRLHRLHEGQRVLLNQTPLSAAARSFVDEDTAGSGAEDYFITALHPFGQQTEMGPVKAAPAASRAQLSLLPVWPNPAQGSAQIQFALPRQGPIKLKIYDLAGRCVRTLWNGPAPQGPQALIWDGRDGTGRAAAGGVYLYRLEAAGQILSRKMLLMR